MSCTFNNIESAFRESNPELADALTQKTLSLWSNLKNSNVFDVKSNALNLTPQDEVRFAQQENLIKQLNDRFADLVTVIDNKISINGLAFNTLEEQMRYDDQFHKELNDDLKNDFDAVAPPSVNEVLGENAELNSFTASNILLGGQSNELNDQLKSMVSELQNERLKLSLEMKKATSVQKQVLRAKIDKINEKIRTLKIQIDSFPINIKRSHYTPALEQMLAQLTERVDNFDYQVDNISNLFDNLDFLIKLRNLDASNPIYNLGELENTEIDNSPLNTPELKDERQYLNDNIADKANKLKERLEVKMKEALEDLLKNDPILQGVSQEIKAEMEAYWNRTATRSDIGDWDVYYFSPSGLKASNGIIPQVAYAEVANSDARYNSLAERLKTKLRAATDAASLKLMELGYKHKIFGSFKPNWNFFFEVNNLGNETGNIIKKFTPTFYSNLQKITNEYYEGSKLARKLATPAQRRILANAKNKLHSFLRNECVVVDIVRLPIAESYMSSGEFADTQQGDPFSGVTKADMLAYEQELISLLGQREYNKLTQRVANTLKNYEELRRQEINSQLSSGPMDSLKQDFINEFEVRNNPFNLFNVINTPFTADTVERTWLNGEILPRRNVAVSTLNAAKTGYDYAYSNTPTNYYNESYEIAESHPALEELLSTMEEILEITHQLLPDSLQRKKDEHFLLRAERTIKEIMLDPNLQLHNKFRPVVTKIWDNLIDYFRGAEIRDPAPLKLKVNASFIETNKNKIDQEFNKLFAEFIAVADVSSDFTKTKVNVNSLNDDQLRIIANAINVPFQSRQQIITEINNKFDGSNLDIKALLNQKATDNIVRYNSTDLPTVLTALINSTTLFAAKDASLNNVSLLRHFYKLIKNPGGLLERENANKQFDDWVKRAVLNYNSREKFGKMTDKVLTTEEKNIKKKLLKLISDLKDQKDVIKRSNINLVQKANNIATIEKQVKSLEKAVKVMGKPAYFSQFCFYLLQGIGRTVMIGGKWLKLIKNTVDNLATVSAYSFSGTYFQNKSIADFNMFGMLNSWARRKLSPSKTTHQQIAGLLFYDYDFFQDGSIEAKAGKGFERKNMFFSSLKSFWAATRIPDFFSQFIVVGVVSKETMVQGFEQDINGNYTIPIQKTLLDVFEIVPSPHNPKVKIKRLIKGFDTPHNIENWIDNNGQDFFDYSNKIKQLIKNINGNTDPLDGVSAPYKFIPALAYQLKGWIMPQITNTLTERHYDLFTKTDREGWAHSKFGIVPHALAGAWFLGLTGIYGAMLGVGISVAYKAKKTKSFSVTPSNLLDGIGDLGILTLAIASRMVSLPINMVSPLVTGKQAMDIFPFGVEAFMNEKLMKKGGSDTDIASFKFAAGSLSNSLLALIMYLGISMRYFDDWDEEDVVYAGKVGMIRKALIYAKNTAQDIYESLNSLAFTPGQSITLTGVAIAKLFEDFKKLMTYMNDLTVGVTHFSTGRNAGKAKIPYALLQLIGQTSIQNFGQQKPGYLQGPFTKWLDHYYNPLEFKKEEIKVEKAINKSTYGPAIMEEEQERMRRLKGSEWRKDKNNIKAYKSRVRKRLLIINVDDPLIKQLNEDLKLLNDQ